MPQDHSHGVEAERREQTAAGLPAPGHHGAETHPGHGAHGDAGHSDHAAQFRDRFWISLLLALPVVGLSPMFSDLLGYTPPAATAWVPPVLGTAVFFYGGWPFLTGAVTELKDRQPGMMLLISLAISVSFGASLATSLGIGGVSLDFWWELALLVVIMLLGHWLEMRALGQASGALDALATLLPDEAERAGADGHLETVSLGALAAGDVVLVRSGARVPADGTVIASEADVDESAAAVTVDAAGRHAHTMPGGVAVQLRASRTRSPRERSGCRSSGWPGSPPPAARRFAVAAQTLAEAADRLCRLPGATARVRGRATAARARAERSTD